MTRKLVDDCFRPGEDRLTHAQAIALIHERVRSIASEEEVAIAEAYGRVLSRDIIAPRDVPQFNNSAVDGYAFAADSLALADGQLEVVTRAAAGHPAVESVPQGGAARIFTGAEMPDGTDTCIMQEDVTLDGAHILVSKAIKRGANTRRAGEDLRAGQIAVAAGLWLRPQEVAAIASTGADRVHCFRRITVGVLSTGDELVAVGNPLGRGQVYDSNRHLLRGLIGSQGAVMEDLGTVDDQRSALMARLQDGAERCDVILTTGGASQGESDHVVGAIRALGSLHSWQIAVKPGRPLAIGQIKDAVVFGLPGNPVAVFVTFLLYAVPMLARLQGRRWEEPRRYSIPAGFAFAGRKRGRREYWRGFVESQDNGVALRKFERDGSGLISGLTRAEGLIEIPEDMGDVAEGDLLAFIPFSEFHL